MQTSPLTDIEQYVVDKVKEYRLKANMSQADLAAHLNVSYGFIGQVENPRERTKYNLKHLNALATIFNCSPKDFLPQKPFNQLTSSK
jgi:transcriptional regulator with XRE-family HTH domain